MLDLIVGSMFSGKSTELIRRMQRAKSIGKACLMVNHSKDTRVAQNKSWDTLKADGGCRASPEHPGTD